MILIRLFRPFIKTYVKNLISDYKQFCIQNADKQSNMNIAKARLMKARIIYYQDRFQPWGDLFLHGYKEFAYEDDGRFEKEMEEIGFNREIREIEWNLLKNDQYPSTLTYYPTKTRWRGNIGEGYDFKERKMHNIDDDDKYHYGDDDIPLSVKDNWVPDIAYPDERKLKK